jgi:hypothetical protein
MSVSTFMMSSGAATLVSVLKIGIPAAAAPPHQNTPCTVSNGFVHPGTPCRFALRQGREGERGDAPTGAAALATTTGGRLRTSVRQPITAAAAAICGLIRCVRPPLP